jgi:hydrophobic/amphiphilic exporter-1 (mainly G- bacteria), HAE1 family
MWISSQAIRRPVTTIVATLAISLLGAIALARLPADEFPDTSPPVVRVTAVYPGASPSTVERELTAPIEEALAAVGGVTELRSTSLDGAAVLVVVFDFRRDPAQAAQDLRDRLAAIRGRLPPEMEEPVIARWDPHALPVVSLALTSSRLDAPALTRIAETELTAALRAAPGVADVAVIGGVERALTVELRPDALAARGVPVAQVVQAVRAENLAAPVGRLSDRFEDRTIRLRGRLERPADFEQIALGRQGEQIVRLGEVARVRDDHAEPRSAALHDGRPAVGIDVLMAPGASTTEVAAAVRAAVERLRPALPPAVELAVVRDAGARVAASLRDVERSLLEGAALTVLVVLLFLRSWRSTVITGLALPVSVLASFIAVWALGYTLNTMSLLGLSLAVGIIVDDAIVVRENIVRHMERGAGHVAAARSGTAEIGLAVAATTAAVVVVFVPIGFMGGLAGQFVRPFALTVAASVLVSLVVSFSLDPMLSALWPEPRGQRQARPAGPLHRALDRLTSRYETMVETALRRRGLTILLALASLAAALAAPAAGLVGSDFVPPDDRGELDMMIETAAGSSLDFTAERASALALRIGMSPAVAHTYIAIGGGAAGAGPDGSERAVLHVRLAPSAGRSADEVAALVRAEARRLGGIRAARAGWSGSARQIEVAVTGPDPRLLAPLAEKVAALVAGVPGAVDVSVSGGAPKRELDVVIDRELAGALGISAHQVAQMLRPAFAGVDAGDWIDPDGEVRPVHVRLAPESRARPEDVEALPIAVAGAERGAPSVIRLGQIADVRPERGPQRVDHLDRRQVMTVGASASGRALSQVARPIEERLARIGMPSGYAVRIGGERRDQEDVFRRLAGALAIAIPLMYLVLVIQFGSFVDPIPIIASLPLALIGAVAALVVTGSTINLMSMTGVVLLMGTVAKNAILLIDFSRRAERRGVARRLALIEAGRARLRPILMTSVAIVAGMIPVALGSGEGGEFRAPLGRVVIGGVITSTALTLLVIPTVYDLLAGWRDRLLRRRAAPPPAASGALPGAVTEVIRRPLAPSIDDDATRIWRPAPRGRR